MRIAIPIWEDRVSPLFDAAHRLLVVEAEDRKEATRSIHSMEDQDPARKCIRLKNLDVDILICGAVSHAILRMLLSCGLDVIQQISGRTEEVLDAYLRGNIFQPRFFMPGCRGYRYRHGKEGGVGALE